MMGVTTIILASSYARGAVMPYSDVDGARFVRMPPQDKKKRYFYRDGHLISIVTWTLACIQESITRLELAIWRVPSMREARILLEAKSGCQSPGHNLQASRAYTKKETFLVLCPRQFLCAGIL